MTESEQPRESAVQLLTDQRVTAFSIGKDRAGTVGCDIAFGGRVYFRTGLASISEGYRWAAATVSDSKPIAYNR